MYPIAAEMIDTIVRTAPDAATAMINNDDLDADSEGLSRTEHEEEIHQMKKEFLNFQTGVKNRHDRTVTYPFPALLDVDHALIGLEITC